MEDIKNIVVQYIKKEKKIEAAVGDLIIDKPYIGQGANGVVYECRLAGNPSINKSFAVKFLTIINSADKTERFVSEFFNVSTLPSNDYVIKNISFDRIKIEDNLVFMILMKKYETNLSAYRKKINKPKFEELIKLFEFLIRSIKFIHENGIIHRDLKPENILIDEFGNYALADFGIAKFNPHMFSLSAKTKNTRLGNRLFSAPEQSENNKQAHETMDVWAFGQILQWFVTGETHQGIGRKLISTFFDEPFAKVMDQIIDRCLQHDYSIRFSSLSKIEDFIEKSKFIPFYNYNYYLYSFQDALKYTFPKGINKLNTSDSKEDISKLLEKISQIWKFKDPVFNLSKSMRINLNSNQLQYEFEDDKWGSLELRKENKIWVLSDHEIVVKKIWCYYSNTAYNDFLVLHIEGMPSYGIYPEPQIDEFEDDQFKNFEYLNYLDSETAGFVDGKYYISSEEVDSGYAEIDQKKVKLSEHQVSLRHRSLKDKFILIGTRHHTYFSPFLNRYDKINKITNKFISNFRLNLPNIDTYSEEFIEEIRKYNSKHKEYLYSIKDDI